MLQLVITQVETLELYEVFKAVNVLEEIIVKFNFGEC